MSKKHVSLEVVNPNAAGIDIGSRSHWVAVGQDAQDVREFGVYTEDYQELSKWLKKHEVTTISATARKLAVIIWNMLAEGIQYQPPKEYLFLDQKRKLKLVSGIKKNISKFDIKPEDVGFFNHLIINN